MTTLEALVALMLSWVPCNDPERCLPLYESIANDALATAAIDPLPYAKRTEHTAVWLLATASLESRFDDAAVSRTGDLCIMQVHPLGKEDVSTRAGCMQAALGRMHWSYDVCRNGSVLSPYKTGKCYEHQRDADVNAARARAGVAKFAKLTR